MFWSPFITHYKPKLQVNIKNQKWHCWVSNQGGHNFYQLFKAVGVSENSWNDLKEYLNEHDEYYYDNTTSEKDLKKAKEWYEKAAKDTYEDGEEGREANAEAIEMLQRNEFNMQ